MVEVAEEGMVIIITEDKVRGRGAKEARGGWREKKKKRE